MNKIKVIIVGTVNIIHLASVFTAMILLVIMTLIISTNVFMRYVLNSGLTWAEEVAKLLVVWFTFIAMAIGIKQGLHISLQLLPAKLPSWLNQAFKLIKDFTILAVSIVMLIYGKNLIDFTKQSIMPATEWPGSTLYIIIPFAAVLIALESLGDIFGIDDDPKAIESGLMSFGKSDADS